MSSNAQPLVPGFSYYAEVFPNHQHKPLRKQSPKELVIAGISSYDVITLKLFLLMLQQKHTYRNAQTNSSFAVTSLCPRRVVLRCQSCVRLICVRFVQDWVLLGHCVQFYSQISYNSFFIDCHHTEFRRKAFQTQ